ncbi:MAG: PD-(D/E)XK nuclease family protein [Planctomycetes bacterium]|nr:PD-(D/E)XK nuclease family protein [Planctomycetota bacterium]
MFVVADGIRPLTAAFASGVAEYRAAHPLDPYLVLVPGYAWADRLMKLLAGSLEKDARGLPLPGGEFIDLNTAAARLCPGAAARESDIYAAALSAAKTMGGEDAAWPSVINSVAAGMTGAIAAGLTAGELRNAAADMPGNRRLGNLASGLAAFARELETRGRMLPEQAMLRADGGGSLRGGALFIFGFYDLSAAQERLARRIVAGFREGGRPVSVFMPSPGGYWGDFARRTEAFWREVLDEEPQTVGEPFKAAGSWKVCRAASPREEAAAAMALVREAVERGIAPERIAIVARDPEPYLPVLEAMLAEHGIKADFGRERKLASTPAGMFAAAMFKLGDIAAPALREGRGNHMPVAAFLRILDLPACSECGRMAAYSGETVTAGIITVGDLMRIAGAGGGTEEPAEVLLKGLAALVDELVAAIAGWAAGDTVGMFAAIKKFTRPDAFGAAEVAALMQEAETSGAGSCGLPVFLLDRARVGSSTGGVHVLSVMAARGLAPEYVVVMGVSEGTFPRRAGGGGLFGHEIRRMMNDRLNGEGTRFALAGDAVAEEHMLFHMTVSSAAGGIFTCSGDGGPSRMVRDMFGDIEYADPVPSGAVGGKVPGPVKRGLGDFLRNAGRGDFSAREGLMRAGTVSGRIVLTPSQIDDYLKCPYLALLRHMLQIGERHDDVSMEPVPAWLWGRAVHRMLDEAFASGGKTPAGDQVDAAVKAATGVVDAMEADGVVRKGAVWQGKRERVIRQIRTYVAQEAREKSAGSVRREFKFEHELDGDALLVGRIDRVDAYEDGTCRLVEYKTGRPEGADKYAQQLALYRYALSHGHETGEDGIEAEMVYFDRPLSGDVQVIKGKALSLDAVAEGIGALVEAYRAGAFVRYPVGKNTCDRCYMYHVCLVSAAAPTQIKDDSEAARAVDRAREFFGVR